LVQLRQEYKQRLSDIGLSLKRRQEWLSVFLQMKWEIGREVYRNLDEFTYDDFSRRTKLSATELMRMVAFYQHYPNGDYAVKTWSTHRSLPSVEKGLPRSRREGDEMLKRFLHVKKLPKRPLSQSYKPRHALARRTKDSPWQLQSAEW